MRLVRHRRSCTALQAIYKLGLRKVRLFRRLPPSTRKIISLVLLCVFVCFYVVHRRLDFVPNLGSELSSPASAAWKETARFESENSLAKKFVCSREPRGNGIEVLRLCSVTRNQFSRSRIVALVELRNVEKSVDVFLTALSQIVDSIVILDDHSTDRTRSFIFLFNERQARYAREATGGQYPSVEILINKTGDWVREELFDRQVLLATGRDVGGTHFVLLDYDEYISSNCVQSGLLRQKILALRPGESLYLPWVELWKSKDLHAVLSEDITMNFLTRRQVVIFGDDGISQFTQENSVAKVVSSNKVDRNASIHVLRCPRSLCSQPPRYRGNPISKGWGNVKLLTQCKIIETRFLNLNNVLLKSAWYEALGRVVGARDGVTTGKMVSMLETKLSSSLVSHTDRSRRGQRESFKLVPTDPHWFAGLDDRIFKIYGHIELWRADNILKWYQKYGEKMFSGLKIMPLLDVPALKSVIDDVPYRLDQEVYHVPQKKLGTIILAVNPSTARVVTDFLIEIGIPQVDLRSVENHTSNSMFWSNPVAVEEWANLVKETITSTYRNNRKKYAFIHCNTTENALTLEMLKLARSELSSLNVLVLFGDRVDPPEISSPFERAIEYATEAGSHLRVLDMPLKKFGSAASIFWLQQQVGNLEWVEPPTSFENRSILFAEKVHQQLAALEISLAPVARLVFSLNVGRCGSRYMATVLKTAGEPITAIHEGQCPGRECSKGGGMRMQDVLLSTSYDRRKRLKLPLIRAGISRALQSHDLRGNWLSSRSSCECSVLTRDVGPDAKRTAILQGDKNIFIGQSDGCFDHDVRDAVYAETNPNFKAWFYDVVLDTMPSAGYDVDVLVVHKYIAAVVKSLFETGFFGTRDGYTWMETSAGVNSRVHIEELRDDNQLDTLEKLMSYVVNAEAVFTEIEEHYSDKTVRQERSRSVRFLHVRAEDVYGTEGTRNLLRQLRLKSSEKTMAVAARVHDKYGTSGRKRIGHITLGECARRVKKFVEHCGGIGSTVDILLEKWGRKDGFNYDHVEQMGSA